MPSVSVKIKYSSTGDAPENDFDASKQEATYGIGGIGSDCKGSSEIEKFVILQID
jgi:hypothetical protein